MEVIYEKNDKRFYKIEELEIANKYEYLLTPKLSLFVGFNYY